MTDTSSDHQHFAKAVVQLGEQQEVVATQAIFNTQGLKIIDQGAAINSALYERLMRHKLATPLEESVHSSSTVTGETLKDSAETIMRDTPFFGRMALDEKTRKLLLNVIETVPLPTAMAFQLTVARNIRPEIYHHLVRTALTAAWLTRTPLVSRYDLGMAAAGGLLHDVGMLHVDPMLLQPDRTLSRDQQRQLYSHPLVSTALLERHHQYSRDVVRAVGEHHEYLDGSGYPRNLRGDAISPLGKVLCLSQVVAAMFAAGRSAPEMRLSVLLRLNTHRYDTTMAMQVVAMLRPQLDVTGAEIPLLANPVDLLCEIDGLVGQWPLNLGVQVGVSDARRQALVVLSNHATQIRRALAAVGAVPDQLFQLGDAALDEAVSTELTLLTHEAAWQVRALARQTRQRWRLVAPEQFPTVLQLWLDQVDAVASRVSGVAAIDGVSEDA